MSCLQNIRFGFSLKYVLNMVPLVTGSPTKSNRANIDFVVSTLYSVPLMLQLFQNNLPEEILQEG